VIEIPKFGMAEEVVHAAIVLVADDDTATRNLLSGLLKAEGYRVFGAQDGQEALDFLITGDPAVALLDVMMPKMTGFEVCLAAKANPETRLIPIVLLTGLSSTDDRIRGITCGADDFLSKPVNAEELVARVKSLVRLKEFTNELESAERVLFSLVLSIEAKDPYTKDHCNHLSRYSVALAERLRLVQGAASRWDRSRCRQSCGARAHSAEDRTIDPGRATDHGTPPDSRGAHLRATEVSSPCSAYHSTSSRKR
jgi:DNA-binding response OmpR family regulator